jgi:hypothetical protein
MSRTPSPTRKTYLAFLGFALTLAGCAAKQPKGYEGHALELSDTAVVVGARKEDFVAQHVELTSVDGLSEIADWKAPSDAVQLLPGRHDVGVKHVYDPPPFTGGMVELAVDALGDVTSEPSTRILRLDLEPGFAYALHVERDPLRYYVSRFQNASSLRPAWHPPASAVKCIPEGERDDVVECLTADAAAEAR